MHIKRGLKGILSHEVTHADLATNWQNDVEVLATPILLWLSELACMRAIDGCLQEDQMTLGYGHDIRHLAPTPPNWIVQIEAELVDMQGAILTFDVSAFDPLSTILSGKHSRAIVSREKFLARLAEKACTYQTSIVQRR